MVKERWCDSEKKYCELQKAECSIEAGHFTQVVSSRSTHVGCAQIKFMDKGDVMCFIQVCRYKPAGNITINGEKILPYKTPWTDNSYTCG